MHTRTSDLSCLQNEHEIANFSYCGEEAHDSGNREKDACKSMQIKMPACLTDAEFADRMRDVNRHRAREKLLF